MYMVCVVPNKKIFNLTDKQIKEIEHNYSGLTNASSSLLYCNFSRNYLGGINALERADSIDMIQFILFDITIT